MTRRRVLTDEVLDDLHADYLRGYSCRELVAVARRRHGIEVSSGGILGGFHRDPERWPTRPKGAKGSTRGFRAKNRTRRRVDELEQLYRERGSVGKAVAAYNERHGTTLSRNSAWELFRRHGVRLKPLKRPTKGEVREALGRRFTRGKGGYWRETTGDRQALHRLVWAAEHGPVPDGRCLIFLDGDPDNCELENLALATQAEVLAETDRGGAAFETKGCLECDRPLRPHEGEVPSAFNKRVFCNNRCKGRWYRGAPRGTRAAERRAS